MLEDNYVQIRPVWIILPFLCLIPLRCVDVESPGQKSEIQIGPFHLYQLSSTQNVTLIFHDSFGLETPSYHPCTSHFPKNFFLLNSGRWKIICFSFIFSLSLCYFLVLSYSLAAPGLYQQIQKWKEMQLTTGRQECEYEQLSEEDYIRLQLIVSSVWLVFYWFLPNLCPVRKDFLDKLIF